MACPCCCESDADCQRWCYVRTYGRTDSFCDLDALQAITGCSVVGDVGELDPSLTYDFECIKIVNRVGEESCGVNAEIDAYIAEIVAAGCTDVAEVVDRTSIGYCVNGVCQQTAAAAMALAIQSGAGTELKKILGMLGIKPEKGCQCNKRARYMDKMGCDWCEQNLDKIVGWLKEEHERRKMMLPFSAVAARQVVKLAIRRAKRGNSQ